MRFMEVRSGVEVEVFTGSPSESNFSLKAIEFSETDLVVLRLAQFAESSLDIS